MKRSALLLTALSLAATGACGGGGKSSAAPNDVCADAKALADAGTTQILDSRDQWKPVIEQAAKADDAEIKQAGTTMQQLLKAAERGDKNVTNGSFSKAFTAFATKCGARGVTLNPPTSTSTTSAPAPST